jgi:Cleft lip and palate transmembrane protein 1 (CLPTM1)
MTSEKYIPVNETVTTLPLRISFDRNDMEQRRTKSTATAGGISPARWRLLTHLSNAIEKQKELGFEESDIDDVKRLIADTNITLLTITLLASALHLLFEFLTFKSEVSFWKKNKDLTGLSVRSLFLDLLGQTIILFYLIEQQSSLLTTVPSGIGCVIALWKCERAAGLRFVRVPNHSKRSVSWYNWLPHKLTGYEFRATRLEARSQRIGINDDMKSHSELAKDRLVVMTIEADRLATKYLGAVLLPLAWCYAIYSLVYKEHKSWYSWMITSLASTVYALGFVLMTPQLFLNWKMKSVAHLPWRVLIYKSLNTFIDDLFSFIIRMPTMARISCFRDDIVFFIYLYQRWLYPVDTSRPVEGGGEDETLLEKKDETSAKRGKKEQ